MFGGVKSVLRYVFGNSNQLNVTIVNLKFLCSSVRNVTIACFVCYKLQI